MTTSNLRIFSTRLTLSALFVLLLTNLFCAHLCAQEISDDKGMPSVKYEKYDDTNLPQALIGLSDGSVICIFQDYGEQASTQSARIDSLIFNVDTWNAHEFSPKSITVHIGSPPTIQGGKVLSTSLDGLAQICAAIVPLEKKYKRVGGVFLDNDHVVELVIANTIIGGELHELNLKSKTRKVLLKLEPNEKATAILGLSKEEILVFTASNKYAVYHTKTKELVRAINPLPITGRSFAKLRNGTVVIAGALNSSRPKMRPGLIDRLVIFDPRKNKISDQYILPETSQRYYAVICQMANGDLALLGELRSFAEEKALKELKILSPHWVAPAAEEISIKRFSVTPR